MSQVELLTYPQRPRTNDFDMAVPYNNQNDNSPNKGQGEGWRMCNLTSAAMIAKYLKPSLWPQYKDFANGMQDTLSSFGDTTDHTAITMALRSVGIESYFSYAASREDLSHSLYMGVPAILGCKYKAGGHMIVAKGRSPQGVRAHCPYGERAGTSDSWIEIGGTSGKDEFMSNNWMSAIVFDQGDEAGWIRFFTSVDGKPTGVNVGM